MLQEVFADEPRVLLWNDIILVNRGYFILDQRRICNRNHNDYWRDIPNTHDPDWYCICS